MVQNMANDIQIGSPIRAVQATALDRNSGTDATPARSSPATVSAAIMHPNPSMHLDPALNMVIINFYDSSGHLTSSLPTAQALAQFRLNMGNDSQSAPTASSVPSPNSVGTSDPASNPVAPAPVQQAADGSSTANHAAAAASMPAAALHDAPQPVTPSPSPSHSGSAGADIVA
jgi:hypothetical protein